MEREPKSIPELEKEQTKLSRFVKDRQHLFESIGTGRVREGANNIATDIKIGRVKARVEASKLRGENHLALVEEDLEKLVKEQELEKLVKEQEEELILKANTYINQVATFRTQLEQLQQYSQYLSPTTLEKHTQSLKELDSLPGRDPELKKALEIRSERLEGEKQQAGPQAAPITSPVETPPTEIESEFMEVFLDPEKRTIRIDGGPEVKLTSIQFALANYMKEHSTEDITHKSLREAVGELSISKNPIARNMWGIEQKLGKIFKTTKMYGSSVWSFIKPLKPTETSEEEPQLPKMIINLETKEVQINGRTRIIDNQVQFNVLVHLAQNVGELVDWEELTRIAVEAGSQYKRPSGDAIFNLRKKLEIDHKNPQLIIRLGPKQQARYRLNAQVEFVGGEQKEGETRKEQVAQRHQEAHQKFVKTLPDGQTIEIRGKITADAFDEIFKGTKENPIPSDQVVGESVVPKLRKILQPYKWNIIQPIPPQEKAKGKTGVYYPQKIDKSQETATTQPEVEKPAGFPYEPVFPTRLEALRAFVENPQTTIEDIIKILGPSKAGRLLTRWQALVALIGGHDHRGAINVLFIRVGRNLATEEERSLWQAIKLGTTQIDDLAVLRTFRERFSLWFKQLKTVTPQDRMIMEQIEAIQPQQITYEEAAILASMIQLNTDKFEVDELTLSTCQGLIDALPKRSNLDLALWRNQYVSTRTAVLEKMGAILDSNRLDEIYDLHKDQDIKTLIIWLFLQRERLGRNLSSLLPKRPEPMRQTETELERLWEQYWQTVFGQQIKDGRQDHVTQEPVSEPVTSTEPPAQAPTKEPAVSEPVAVLPQTLSVVEEKPERPKMLTIEKRDPDIRQTIDDLLKKLDEFHIRDTIGNPLLTKIFPVLKVTVVEKMIEDHIISPIRGKDHHPAFNLAEIVKMAYIFSHNRNHGGIQTKMVKEIDKIIAERIALRKNKASS